MAWRWRGIDISPFPVAAALVVVSDALRIRDMEVEANQEAYARALSGAGVLLVRRGKR